MKFGTTTGTCFIAAAKAGLVALLSSSCIDSIAVETPIGLKLKIDISRCEISSNRSYVCVTKDAGDNASFDVTHNIEVCVEVEYEYYDRYVIVIIGCDGVGVTREGNLAISDAVLEYLDVNLNEIVSTGLIILRVYIPEGRKVWERTLNKDLGIYNGISILGEKGIELPISNPYFSPYLSHVDKLIEQYAEYSKSICLTLGGKSSKIASVVYSNTPIIEVGDHLGYAIDKCIQKGINHIIIVGGLAKMIKVSMGILMMHSAYIDARIESFIGLLMRYSVERGVNISREVIVEILECKSINEALNIVSRYLNIVDFVRYIIELCKRRLTDRCFRLFGASTNFEVCIVLPDSSYICS